MNIDTDTVKSLLIKHFGAPRPSLTLDARSSKGARTYFCALENEDGLKRIRDVLAAGYAGERIPRLLYELPNKNGKRYPLCALLREEDGFWKAEFARVRGVIFHSTYGKKAAATLDVGDRRATGLASGGRNRYRMKRTEEKGYEPFLIPDDDAYRFYGFWDALPEGGTYGVPDHINRALFTEPRFRAFAVDFFLLGAKEFPILRAVAKTINDTGYFLPRVPFSELVKHESAESLIESFSEKNARGVAVVNASDINAGYLTALLAPRVEARDLYSVARITAADVPRLVRYYDLDGGADVARIVRNIYFEKYESLSAATAAEAYAREQIKEGAPVSLSLSRFRLNEKYGI